MAVAAEIAMRDRFLQQFQSDARVMFFEVPMIGRLARLTKPSTDGGIRRGTPKAAYGHIVTVYREKAPWRHRGAFDQRQFQTVSTKVAELVRES
jgi:hypothetical protein